MGLFSKKTTNPLADAHPTTAITDVHLPDDFNIWYKDNTSNVTVYIGQHEEKSHFMIGEYPKSWFGPVVLCNGLTIDDPVVLRMEHTNPNLSEATVELFNSPPSEGQAPSMEKIRYRMKGTHDRYWFAAQIGIQVEKFEWRRSSGEETKALEGFGDCWKLARIGPIRSGENLHEDFEDHEYGKTSDGKEIVAVTAFRKGLRTIGRIQFINSAGLGQQWKIMVLMSHLIIYDTTVCVSLM